PPSPSYTASPLVPRDWSLAAGVDRLKVLAAIGGRGRSHEALEHAGEMTLIGKAGFERDLGEGDGVCAQPLPGLAYAQPAGMGPQRLAEDPAKRAGEAHGADTEVGCQRLHAQSAVGVAVESLAGAFEP